MSIPRKDVHQPCPCPKCASECNNVKTSLCLLLSTVHSLNQSQEISAYLGISRKSSISTIFWKLSTLNAGHPHSEMNLSSDLNKGASQHTQWYTPLSSSFHSLEVWGSSVPRCLVTSNATSERPGVPIIYLFIRRHCIMQKKPHPQFKSVRIMF